MALIQLEVELLRWGVFEERCGGAVNPGRELAPRVVAGGSAICRYGSLSGASGGGSSGADRGAEGG